MRYLFPILIIISCIIVFSALIQPRYAVLKETREEVASANTNLKTADTVAKSRQDLINKYNNIPKEDLDDLKTLLPDSVDNIRLIIQLNSLARNQNLSVLRNVNYETRSDEENPKSKDTAKVRPYGEFTISFETTGPYKNFLAFLSALEQNLRLVDVTSVTFTSNPKSSEQPLNFMTYNVTLKTYWLRK